VKERIFALIRTFDFVKESGWVLYLGEQLSPENKERLRLDFEKIF